MRRRGEGIFSYPPQPGDLEPFRLGSGERGALLIHGFCGTPPEVRGLGEHLAANGKLELLGKRALSVLGNELGTVDDISFDPGSGAVETLTVADRQIPANAVLGAGSYAVVIDAGHDPV